MKNAIFSTLVALMSASAYADVTPLPAGTEGLYPITQATSVQVLNKRPRFCPRGRVCEAASAALVSVTLSGCLDTLGPVAFDKEILVDGKLQLTVSAVGLANSRSRAARCVAPNVKQFTIPLGFGFITENNVVVKFLTSSAYVGE